MTLLCAVIRLLVFFPVPLIFGSSSTFRSYFRNPDFLAGRLFFTEVSSLFALTPIAGRLLFTEVSSLFALTSVILP